MEAITLSQLREYGRHLLSQAAGGDTVLLDVDLLLAKAIGQSREYLLIHSQAPVGAEVQTEFEALIQRRKAGEPIAYLLGRKEFFGNEFLVNPSVLIPRPETEVLVEQALELFTERPGTFALVDIGAGSGCIILSLLNELRARFGEKYLEQGTALAVDVSPQALRTVAANARKLGLRHRVSLVASDLFSGVTLSPESVELFVVLSNPPYVTDSEKLPVDVECFEPRLALRAGPKGLDVIGRLIDGWASLTNPKNKKVLLFEYGFGQELDVESLLQRAGIKRIRIIKDLRGLNRAVEAMV